MTQTLSVRVFISACKKWEWRLGVWYVLNIDLCWKLDLGNTFVVFALDFGEFLISVKVWVSSQVIPISVSERGEEWQLAGGMFGHFGTPNCDSYRISAREEGRIWQWTISACAKGGEWQFAVQASCNMGLHVCEESNSNSACEKGND